MAESQILILGPGGASARMPLPDDVPVGRLRSAIGHALGLVEADSLTLRNQSGSLIDLRGSLASAMVRSGDLILVEVSEVLQSRGFLRRRGQQEAVTKEIIPSAYRVLPCYLAVDASGSMREGPIETINAELPRLRMKMLRDPELAEVCQLALVTFSDKAHVVVPLTEVLDISFPTLHADGMTDYRQPFELLRTMIASDLYELYLHGRRPYRPVVFFLSDGLHNGKGDWRPSLASLTDRGAFHGAPNVISFGFGEANADAIAAVGRKAAYMPEAGGPSAKLEAFMNFLLSSLTTSMTQGARDQDDVLVIPAAPSGWRALRVPQ